MKIVLTEEEYFAKLSAILKRDFFPSLAELDEEMSEVEAASLADFQAHYTTEDNASFEELLERENERKRKGFERVFGAPALLCDDPSRRLLLKDSLPDESKVKCIAGSAAVNDTKPYINLKGTRFSKATETNNSSNFACPSPLLQVPLTPQINPTDEPVFTFGTVASTPLHLEGSETPSRFRLPPTPVREQIAHSLAARSGSVAKRKKRAPVVPRYDLKDLKSLTPKR